MTNTCDRVSEEEWEQNMTPLFAFEKPSSQGGVRQFSHGTGMGLSTVHALTKALDCNFEVRLQEENNLVQVCFNLPLEDNLELLEPVLPKRFTLKEAKILRMSESFNSCKSVYQGSGNSSPINSHLGFRFDPKSD